MTGRSSAWDRSWRAGTARGIGTLGIGAIGGALFWYLQIPLSWLLGAMIAVGLLHALSLPLDLPASWRRWTMVAIGTMLGSGFGPDSASGFVAWAPSIGIMLTLTAVCALATFVAIRRWSNLDETSAFLAALPGGYDISMANHDLVAFEAALLAKALNTAGIQTRRGDRWHVSTVRNLLARIAQLLPITS